MSIRRLRVPPEWEPEPPEVEGVPNGHKVGSYPYGAVLAAMRAGATSRDIYNDEFAYEAKRYRRARAQEPECARCLDPNGMPVSPFMMELIEDEGTAEDDLPDVDLPELLAELERLSPRHQAVLRLRFGIGCDPKTLKEIGKIIDRTHETVRWLEAQAIGTIRNALVGKRRLDNRCERVNHTR